MFQIAIQSSFILGEIKKTSRENRKRIRDLFLLCQLMQKQKLSSVEGQHYFVLRNKYQDEYACLLKETNPIKYHVYIEEQQKLLEEKQDQIKMASAHKEKQIQQEIEEYQKWLALQKRA
jgi:hypothetical protein